MTGSREGVRTGEHARVSVERPVDGAAVDRRAQARVLVVDDTEGNRYAVTRLLRRAGMQVTEAETAAAALEQLANEVPDLVVLDINLPDGSGFDLCRRIKEEAATAATPVMHVSASFVTSADRVYGLEHGADAYLTHPLDPDIFLATARALLRAEGERERLVQTEQQARVAAEQARVAAEQTAARATLLQDLTAALARTMSPAEVARVAIERSRAALGAQIGLLTVASEDGTELALLGSANLPEEALDGWRRFPVTREGPMAVAVRTGEPVSAESPIALRARYPEGARLMMQHLRAAPRSTYAVPIILDRGPNQRVLGALMLLWTQEGGFGGADASLLGAVADQCAIALERARLYEAERAAREAAEAARVEAEQANAVKAQFLATMSHELRTPLNAIGGYAQLLELGVHGPINPAQAEALSRIQHSQKHLLGLINSVLNFARLEAGRVHYDIAPLAALEAVRTVTELVLPQAQAKGIELQVVAASLEGVVVRGDAEKFRQVLLNLLSNGVKFTESGGRVTVDCAGGDDHVRLRVMDTGRGIPPDHVARIFDPFVQVGRRLSSGDEGTGLGLAISRDLARGMGGDITVESEAGRGSVFVLTLPRG